MLSRNCGTNPCMHWQMNQMLWDQVMLLTMWTKHVTLQEQKYITIINPQCRRNKGTVEFTFNIYWVKVLPHFSSISVTASPTISVLHFLQFRSCSEQSQPVETLNNRCITVNTSTAVTSAINLQRLTHNGNKLTNGDFTLTWHKSSNSTNDIKGANYANINFMYQT